MQNRKIKGQKPVTVSAHRFRDHVALSILNSNDTVYMTEDEARRAGEALVSYADSIKTEKFSNSTRPGSVDTDLST